MARNPKPLLEKRRTALPEAGDDSRLHISTKRRWHTSCPLPCLIPHIKSTWYAIIIRRFIISKNKSIVMTSTTFAIRQVMHITITTYLNTAAMLEEKLMNNAQLFQTVRALTRYWRLRAQLRMLLEQCFASCLYFCCDYGVLALSLVILIAPATMDNTTAVSDYKGVLRFAVPLHAHATRSG